MANFIINNPLRRIDDNNNAIPFLLTHNGIDAVDDIDCGLFDSLSFELISYVLSHAIFDDTGTATLPRLNFLLSLRSTSKMFAVKGILSNTIFDAFKIERLSNCLSRINPSTQRFIINSMTGGIKLPLIDNSFDDNRESPISLFIFKDSDTASAREEHWDSHKNKVNMCIAVPIPESDQLIAIELDVELAVRIFGGHDREVSIVYSNTPSVTKRHLQDIFYHNYVDKSFLDSNFVKRDRIEVEIFVEQRLRDRVVRIGTSKGGEPLLAEKDLSISYDTIARVFGHFDTHAIAVCPFRGRFGNIDSIVPCAEIIAQANAEDEQTRREIAILADAASNKHTMHGNERTRVQKYDPAYDGMRAAAEVLGMRDARLVYSDSDQTSDYVDSDEDNDDEDYKPRKRKAKPPAARRKKKKATVAPPAAVAGGRAGSSLMHAISLMSDSDDED